MAEPTGTAEIDSSGSDLDAAGTMAGDVPELAGERDGDEARAEGDEPAKAPEAPRRRLVAELLEGQDSVDETSCSGLQLVAPPLHLEPVDEGQPIYQLDLSSDEPQGVIVAREPYDDVAEGRRSSGSMRSSDGYEETIGAEAGPLQAIKRMIVLRERRIMAAERDGIGAYQLAIELDGFVRALVEALRRVDG